MIETWNVATRPLDKNGLDQTPEEAYRLVENLERLFPRVSGAMDTYGRWQDLVVRFHVSGVQVHDARLVALMLSHDISDILTFNARDFRRYAAVGVRAIDPKKV